jgi:hypothetical protein
MLESREAVWFMNFVEFLRTCISHQVSLAEREISHKLHKVHKVAGECTP